MYLIKGDAREEGEEVRGVRETGRDAVVVYKVVKICGFAPRRLFTECFNYARCWEAKVPTQTEEALSGKQEKNEVRLMRKEVSRCVGFLTLVTLAAEIRDMNLQPDAETETMLYRDGAKKGKGAECQT